MSSDNVEVGDSCREISRKEAYLTLKTVHYLKCTYYSRYQVTAPQGVSGSPVAGEVVLLWCDTGRKP